MADLLERVRATGLITGHPPPKVVVLLSGGRDSVCLLDLAVRLGCETAALHVDHGLRADSAADAAFCAELCRELRVELTVRHAGGFAGGNVQAWARERPDLDVSPQGVIGRLHRVAGHLTDQLRLVYRRYGLGEGRDAAVLCPTS